MATTKKKVVKAKTVKAATEKLREKIAKDLIKAALVKNGDWDWTDAASEKRYRTGSLRAFYDSNAVDNYYVHQLGMASYLVMADAVMMHIPPVIQEAVSAKMLAEAAA